MKCTGKTTQKNVQLATGYYTKQELIDMFENLEDDLILCRLEEGRSHYYTFKEINHDHNMVTNLFYYFDSDLDYVGVTLHQGDDLKVILDEFGYYENVLVRGKKKYHVNVI